MINLNCSPSLQALLFSNLPQSIYRTVRQVLFRNDSLDSRGYLTYPFSCYCFCSEDSSCWNIWKCKDSLIWKIYLLFVNDICDFSHFALVNDKAHGLILINVGLNLLVEVEFVSILLIKRLPLPILFGGQRISPDTISNHIGSNLLLLSSPSIFECIVFIQFCMSLNRRSIVAQYIVTIDNEWF